MSTLTFFASAKYNPLALAILRISRLLHLSTEKNEHVSYVYKLSDGPLEIDVFALAPTLLSLGKLIQESNQTLYPEGHQIAVNVKPFREGSFIVDITLFHSEAFYPIFAIGKDIPPNQIIELLGMIGLIKHVKPVADTVSSVLDLIKKLRGQPAKVEELKGGDYRYTVDDKSFTVNAPIHQLTINQNVTNNLYEAVAKPLEETEFKAVEGYLEGQENETASIVTKEDVPALKSYTKSNAQVDERLEENIQENVLLNPKRGAFDGDGSQWSFHRGQKEVITATIRDQAFLKKLELGEIRPNHADLMKVTLKETQKLAGTQIESSKWVILEVTSYTVGARQMNIESVQASLMEGKEPKALPPAPDDQETSPE